MSADGVKPGRGRHVFVVLRRDDFIDDPVDVITGTKAFGSQEHAQAEADRLNLVNRDKGARYFVRMARLQEAESDR